MQGVSGWRFAPQWWPSFGAWILIVLFLFFADWQWRAARSSEVALQASAHSVTVRSTPWPIGRLPRPFERVSVRGHFLVGRDLLLIDLYHHNQIGAEVVTVFRPRRGTPWIPVDRGWIPASSLGHTRLPLDPGLPPGLVRIKGYAGALPHPGLHLGNGPIPRGWPKPILFPTHAFLEKIYGHSLTRPVLLLGSREPGGFVRDWKPVPPIGPGRHFGYALQWLLLALLVFGIWVGLNLHRESPS